MPASTAVDRPDSAPSATRQESIFGPVMSSLGWPTMVGLVAFWAFLMALSQGWIESELLVRYLSAHPVSYVATGMFFVGIAGLGLKLANVTAQIFDKPRVKLSAVPALAQRPESSRHLLQELDELSPARQNSYLGTRLRNALEFVDKTESANGLEDELKYLADIDADKQQESFALTRILIWAIPMLGFLGTVIGISGALGGLTVEADFNSMLTGLKEKLYVAFDTTALALTLSIVLMFAQFVVNRVETQLLTVVDAAATEELSGRFTTYGSNRDPYLASVERMSQQVLDCMTDVNAQQAEVWNRGLTAIQETTDASLGKFAEVLADRLSKQLDPIMDEFGVALRSAITDSTNYLDSHGKKLAEAMKGSVELIDQSNREMIVSLASSSDTMKNVVDAHSEGLKQCLVNSEETVAQQLHEVRQVMGKTMDLVSEQSQHLAQGMENSHELMQTNSESVKQAIDVANKLIREHGALLNEAVVSSSRAVEEHSQKVTEAVTRSEEIVDRRQETINLTQENMLKAQTQQSMAISNFTEKLETLQEMIEQFQAVGQMQSTMNETLSTLERSDTIAKEIHGLARLVREQIKSIDQMQLTQAEATDQQWSAIIQQLQTLLDQNSTSLEVYQQKMDGLVATMVNAQLANTTQLKTGDPQSADPQSAEQFQTLMLQLVNQNQSLAMLSEQLKESLNLTELGNHLAQVLEELRHQQTSNSNHSVQLEQQLASLAETLNQLNHSLVAPTDQAAESSLNFGAPDTPKRVA